MTLALRILRAYVGEGAASNPTPFQISTQQGLWNTISEPVAHYYNGKTYIAWGDDSGRIWAAQWVHATQTLSTPVNVGTISTHVDGAIHVTPAILVRSSDHRIMVWGCANGSPARPGYWLSTNPEDATAFGSVNLVGNSGTFTYVSPFQLNSVTNAPIYVFTKYWSGGTGYLAYYKSTDGGSTWSGVTPALLLGPQSTTTLYWRIGTNTTDRIDIFATNTDRVASPSSVYHFYLLNDNLYKSDGTLVGAAGSGPYTANSGTLIQNSSLGPARCNGWAYSSGNPCALILITSGGTTTIARVGRWTGSAWQVDTVTGADSNGFVGGNQFLGSGAMPKDNPDVMYFPQKVGSFFELFRYFTTNSGSSWSGSQVTSGSSADNTMPDTPLDAASGLMVIWGLGTYTNDDNFDFDIWGAGN